ncbi:MAG: hypothetical protein E6I75_03645 [Chloroflexi bacterium]|nr:MAG: hypothetical protein E6I75_03645 [Chloroflexota bacterium]
MPDHTWLGLSDEDWAVNLRMYATQPERFLQLQCEERLLVQSARRGLTAGPVMAAGRRTACSRLDHLTKL